MDSEEFYNKLRQFATIKQVKVPRSAGLREADEPDTVYRNGHEFQIDKDNNPTIGWVVDKIARHPKECDDCGKTVTNRVVDHKFYFNPEKHWREHCKNCQKIRDPYTEEFTLTTTRSYAVFSAFLSGKEAPTEYQPKEESISKVVHKKPTK
jgi:hypothetical protein